MFHPTHVLVTGGSGFIGSNFVRFALSQRANLRVTNLDALTYSGNLENLADVQDDPRYRFVRGDIRDAQVIEPLLAECDAVVHFAAESHVDRSIIDSRPFVESNILGTQVLLDAARRVWKDQPDHRFVHVSTDEVYGDLPLDRPELLFTEDTPINAHSPYSASKASSDLLVAAACHTFGFNASITRCSNNFGPYQFPEKVIPLFTTNLLDGAKVPLYGDGGNVRDWIHVHDHNTAADLVLRHGTPGEVYNIGGGNELTNKELTYRLLALTGRDEAFIQPVEDRKGHDRRYSITHEKVTALGWKAEHSLEDGLAATVEWYRDNRWWWEPLKARAAF